MQLVRGPSVAEAWGKLPHLTPLWAALVIIKTVPTYYC
jgi:hypothetical protein